jgi:hypothetical protein
VITPPPSRRESYYSESPHPSAGALAAPLSTASLPSAMAPAASNPTTGARTVVGTSSAATVSGALEVEKVGEEEDEYEYAYVYQDELPSSSVAMAAADQIPPGRPPAAAPPTELAAVRALSEYSYSSAASLVGRIEGVGLPEPLSAPTAPLPVAEPTAQVDPGKLRDAEIAQHAAAAVGAAAAAAAAAAALARAEAEASSTLSPPRRAAEGANLGIGLLSERSFLSVESSEPGLPSRTLSLRERDARVAAEEAAVAAAEAAEAARIAAITYKPLPATPVEPGIFGDDSLLDALPIGLAERAQRYYAAATKADETLRRQLDTLRQMQFAAARLMSELKGAGEAPANGWDKEGAGKGSGSTTLASSAHGDAALQRSVLGLVKLHEAP